MSFLSDICIVGSDLDINDIRPLVSAPHIIPVVVSDITTADNQRKVEESLNRLFDGDGPLRPLLHWWRKIYPDGRHRAVLFHDNMALAPNSLEFVSKLASRFEQIPSYFVLVEHMPSSQREWEKAFDSGMDDRVSITQLDELDRKASEHYQLVSRNRLKFGTILTGVVITVLATTVLSYMHGMLESFGASSANGLAAISKTASHVIFQPQKRVAKLYFDKAPKANEEWAHVRLIVDRDLDDDETVNLSATPVSVVAGLPPVLPHSRGDVAFFVNLKSATDLAKLQIVLKCNDKEIGTASLSQSDLSRRVVQPQVQINSSSASP